MIPQEDVERVYLSLSKTKQFSEKALENAADPGKNPEVEDKPSGHKELAKMHKEMQDKFKNLKDHSEKEINTLRKELEEAQWKYESDKADWETKLEEISHETMQRFQKEQNQVLQSLLDKSAENPEKQVLMEILKQELK